MFKLLVFLNSEVDYNHHSMYLSIIYLNIDRCLYVIKEEINSTADCSRIIETFDSIYSNYKYISMN